MQNLFVYGTLKEGFRLNALLADNGATKIGHAVLRDYYLISTGSYPIAIQPISYTALHRHCVVGEIWSVPDHVYTAIVQIERAAGYSTGVLSTPYYASAELAIQAASVDEPAPRRTSGGSPVACRFFHMGSRPDFVTLRHQDIAGNHVSTSVQLSAAERRTLLEYTFWSWRQGPGETGYVDTEYAASDARVTRALRASFLDEDDEFDPENEEDDT